MASEDGWLKIEETEAIAKGASEKRASEIIRGTVNEIIYEQRE
jgi:hypothetical protein